MKATCKSMGRSHMVPTGRLRGALRAIATARPKIGCTAGARSVPDSERETQGRTTHSCLVL
eukprot:1280302-Pyramimonas_sp.AAC.1